MDLFDLFKRKLIDPELCRLRDLYTTTYADGEMLANERKAILEIAEVYNVSSQFYQMIIIKTKR